MMNRSMNGVLIALICMALTSCVPKQNTRTPFNAYDLNPGINSGEYVPKVDNFIVILDASNSMDDTVNKQRKFDLAKDIVTRLNQTIPNIALKSGLRTYGKGITLAAKEKTRLIYGMTDYATSAFQGAIDNLKNAEGLSFMDIAIQEATNDLGSFEGKNAVIIVSDGKIQDDSPIIAARDMKNKYGDKVCIYTIFIPSDTTDTHQVTKDKELMKNLAMEGKCGFSTEAMDVQSPERMAEFVTKVFLTSPMDTDGDGVSNDMDQCPDTPANVKVDARGCPIDSDLDGVPDYLDQCENTPQGTEVDKNGCPIDASHQTPQTEGDADADSDGVADKRDDCPETPLGVRVNDKGCWILQPILFELNKSKVRPEYFGELDEVAEAMKMNPNLKIQLEGHTCNIGTSGYNQKLSEKRAKAVKTYLLNKGIPEARLSQIGYGLTRPAEPNDTEQGRKKNRRVELKTLKIQ